MTETEKCISWEYPYDAASCGCCVLNHAFGSCKDVRHQEFSKVAEYSGLKNGKFEDQRHIFLKLREKFDHFYPMVAPVSVVEPVIVEPALEVQEPELIFA